MKPVVTVHEYETKIVDGLRLSTADLALAASPQFRERLKLSRLLDGRLSVEAGSHVGVIELDCATFQVHPKLAGSELDVLAMFDYASGLHALQTIQNLRAAPDQGHDLRDLVCLLLTKACEDLLRRGLRRDYVRREEALPILRGRLLADRQVMRRFGQLDHLECRFDEFDSDILDNRLCSAALHTAARTAQDPDVRSRARRTAAQFAGVCRAGDIDPRLAAERLTYHRANEHYRAAHQWALLLLQRGGLHDLYSASPRTLRSFTFDMNTLFESFVTRLLREAVSGTGISVHAKESLSHAIRHENGGSYTQITPDIRLSGGRGLTASSRSVDAKYKLYTDRRISTPDLYQSFAYALALSSRGEAAVTPTACLVYASRTDPAPKRIVMHRTDGDAAARIIAIGLNIPATLAALRTSSQGAILKKFLGALTVDDTGATTIACPSQ